MKLIHTADLHLGSPLTSRLPESKRRQRRRELLSNLSRLTERARELGVSAIIISGDLFDSQTVSEGARSAFLGAVSASPDIEFFCLGGNHDGALADGICQGLVNFHTFPKNDWASYRLGDGVVISGRSECGEEMFSSLRLNKEDKNIVLLHGELRERSAHPDTVGLREAKDKNIDYLALGHYHSYSEAAIDSHGVAVYSGTPEGRGFDEAGECGFVLIDTEGEGMTHTFIPFAKRVTHIVRLPLDGLISYPEIENSAREALSKIPSADIVRLTLSGRYTLGLWKDTEALLRAFANDFYYFEVKDTSRPAVKAEDFIYDKSLKGEFIRLVLADTTLSEDERERIISTGISALTGEGGDI